MEKRGLFTIVLAAVLFASLGIISAIGVANSYWDDKPLKLAPGESTIISLRLQNEETAPVTVEVTLNSEIATLFNGTNEYEVPADKVSLPVYLRVSVPENAEVGTKYTIFASFKKVSGGEGGAVSVAQGITSKVPVEVVSSVDSELYGQGPKINYLLVVVLLIALAVAIALAYHHLKKGKKQKPSEK